MPTMVVHCAAIALDARRELAASFTSAFVEACGIPAEKVQIFFGDDTQGARYAPSAVTVYMLPVSSVHVLKSRILYAARSHLPTVTVTIRQFDDDHAAKAGRLRSESSPLPD